MRTTIFIMGWIAVLMGMVHIFLVFPLDEFRLGHLWYIGSGLTIVFAGFINLLGQVLQQGTQHRIFILLTNVVMCALFIAATLVLNGPQVYFGIAIFGVLSILAILDRSKKVS